MSNIRVLKPPQTTNPEDSVRAILQGALDSLDKGIGYTQILIVFANEDAEDITTVSYLSNINRKVNQIALLEIAKHHMITYL